MTTQIALQMYTLREFCKTPADVASTLKRVKQIGYDAIQASGMVQMDPAELRKVADGEGIRIVATHLPLDRIDTDAAQVIDDHAVLGVKYTAIGGYFGQKWARPVWDEFITRYNGVAKKYAGSTLRIGYHNHSHEFMKFDGKAVMQMLIDGLSSEVWIELDTYWVQHGGGDPAQWISKVKGRIPCVHLKDMTVTADPKVVMAEVGEGNLNWAAILRACRDAGVEWYIIEQDSCQRDPFESVAISLKNVKAMGLS